MLALHINGLTPAAPKKQPPAKVETMAPRIPLDGLNLSRKGVIVMTEAITPLLEKKNLEATAFEWGSMEIREIPTREKYTAISAIVRARYQNSFTRLYLDIWRYLACLGIHFLN